MMLSGGTPRASRSDTSLKPPSMLNADAERAAIHPEDPEASLIGKQLTGPNRVDVFRRKRDADDRQRAPTAVDDGRDRDRRGRSRAPRRTIRWPAPRRAGPDRSSGRGAGSRSLSSGRPRSGSEISRPLAGSAMPGTSIVTSATTRVATASTPGISRNRSSSLARRALERGEDVGEARLSRRKSPGSAAATRSSS